MFYYLFPSQKYTLHQGQLNLVYCHSSSFTQPAGLHLFLQHLVNQSPWGIDFRFQKIQKYLNDGVLIVILNKYSLSRLTFIRPQYNKILEKKKDTIGQKHYSLIIKALTKQCNKKRNKREIYKITRLHYYVLYRLFQNYLICALCIVNLWVESNLTLHDVL